MPQSSTTRYAVLGVLASCPMTGYEIRRFVAQSIGFFWSESYGQLYPTLRQLTAEGLVVVHERDGDRTTYAITESGRAALRAWADADVVVRPPRNELLLRLFFGRHLSLERLVELVTETRAAEVEALATLRDAEEAIAAEPADPDRPYHLMTLRAGLVATEAQIAWYDQTLAALRQLADQPAGDIAAPPAPPAAAPTETPAHPPPARPPDGPGDPPAATDAEDVS